MGNKYSVVREEADEAEFRRLVEAVEIAQQRAVPRDDIESGINVVLNTRGRHRECSRQPKDHNGWSIDDMDRIDDQDSPIVLPSPRSLSPTYALITPCIRAAASTLSSKSRTSSPHSILVVPSPPQVTQSHDHDVLTPTWSPPPTLDAIPNDPPRMIHCRMASRLPTERM
ncbi:hypothetical protein A0H81_07392 [Grifola frondosa]|uniref:Uncharacterized protein n=1 Tax=Grifola frondosa TaxID=5627 RepID=A0A1C7M5G1_GRIFR|nr:hypothetical protein A0H81_07392 [Grifola frondosa]